jgi:hypothetical protein
VLTHDHHANHTHNNTANQTTHHHANATHETTGHHTTHHANSTANETNNSASPVVDELPMPMAIDYMNVPEDINFDVITKRSHHAKKVDTESSTGPTVVKTHVGTPFVDQIPIYTLDDQNSMPVITDYIGVPEYVIRRATPKKSNTPKVDTTTSSGPTVITTSVGYQDPLSSYTTSEQGAMPVIVDYIGVPEYVNRKAGSTRFRPN